MLPSDATKMDERQSYKVYCHTFGFSEYKNSPPANYYPTEQVQVMESGV